MMFEFEYIKEVSEDVLKKIWQDKFSDKPFPRVRAYILKDVEFERIVNLPRIKKRQKEDQIFEYGRSFSFTRAFVVMQTDGSFQIFVRESTPYLQNSLKHELKHVYNYKIDILIKERERNGKRTFRGD